MMLQKKYKLILSGLIVGLICSGWSCSKQIKNSHQNENSLVCPSSNKTLKGTDIFDADTNINWTSLKNNHIEFVFIKATEGETFISNLYAEQKEKAVSNNMIYAPYHFFHPKDDPHLQAKIFLETVGTLDKNHLPPMLDWEVSDNASVEEQVKNAKIWLDDIEKAVGVKPIIYLSPSFFNTLGNPEEFKDYPLFIANYDVTCPMTPNIWKTWIFWQVGTKPLEGIPNRKSDIDVFNGSKKDLNQFIKKSWKLSE